MNFLKKLFQEVTPKSSIEDAPMYYKKVLIYSYDLLIVYFLCFIVFSLIQGYPGAAVRTVPWIIVVMFCIHYNNHIQPNLNMPIFAFLVIGWVFVFVRTYGWDCGGQHFILPLLVIVFFSLYDSLLRKLIFLAVLFLLRMSLFFYCLNHEPIFELKPSASAALQIITTAFIFALMAIICTILSTNIQEAEKQLLIYNQELKRQADTDPLTLLPNRRYMITLMEKHMRNTPKQTFSVALGDIDLFKNVNDTYGHNCGDLVLKELAKLFQRKIAGKGCVCRWGGEEFFFFMPNLNIDDAAAIISEINVDISRLEIHYRDITIHITMTFGVEDYDFQSSLTDLIKNADDKLYIGKQQGRNRVIF